MQELKGKTALVSGSTDGVGRLVAKKLAEAGAKAKAAASPPKSNPPKPVASRRPEGRPATKQHEGKIPGVGQFNPVREFAQSMGSNGIGLSQMSE